MANYCCTEFIDNCKHNVTIGWLKTYIGNYIQKSDGTTFVIDSSSYTDDEYCPTYSELTAGTLVQNAFNAIAGQWQDNQDGIHVKNLYNDNEVVKREDIQLYFTRFLGYSISPAKSQLSECEGDSTTISNTYSLRRTLKSIDSSCEAATTYMDGMGYAPDSYSSSEEWLIISGNTITAEKNGTISASSRTAIVSSSVTFRGETHDSNNIAITQDALSGQFQTSGITICTGITVTHSTPTTFDCEGGEFSVTGTARLLTTYKWVDSCGQIYTDTTRTEESTANLGVQAGHFDEVECPIESASGSSSFTFVHSGVTSETITYTQNCNQQCCQGTGYTATTCNDPEITVNKCGETVTIPFEMGVHCSNPSGPFTAYTDYSVNWTYVSGTSDFVTFGGYKNLTYTIEMNCTGEEKIATYVRTVTTPDGLFTQECTFTFRQTDERCGECPCGCESFNLIEIS